MSTVKILLVGETNPYGADPYYSLYPEPDLCSGHRLCVKILGMSKKEYLDEFDRVNLCEGKWSIMEARKKAETLYGRSMVLLGSRVCSAFGVTFKPFSIEKIAEVNCLKFHHPSGLCRAWGDFGVVQTARDTIAAFRHHVASIVEVQQNEEPVSATLFERTP